MLDAHDTDRIPPPARDSVRGLQTETEPTIVSISDIHGFLSEAHSALTAVGEHPAYDPIVEMDFARRLHWAGGEEYVLVFNGDLVDRGPQSGRVVDMVTRLIDEAPPGHVRVTVGNHEMGVLMPELYGWSDWYSGTRSLSERREFIDQIHDGHVVAAYEGYNVTYVHAGQPDPFEVADVNASLIEGTEQILAEIGKQGAFDRQQRIVNQHPRVFGYAGETGRGPNAGLTWLDFEHLSEDAPPQVVGHTRQDAPIRTGNVICQNVIRSNRRSDGGEAVVVETPDRLAAVGRSEDGSVEEYTFSLPSLSPSQSATTD